MAIKVTQGVDLSEAADGDLVALRFSNGASTIVKARVTGGPTELFVERADMPSALRRHAEQQIKELLGNKEYVSRLREQFKGRLPLGFVRKLFDIATEGCRVEGISTGSRPTVVLKDIESFKFKPWVFPSAISKIEPVDHFRADLERQISNL